MGWHLSPDPVVWIGAALTLMVMSFLWRDNPLYKLAEHIFVGASAAYIIALEFWTTFWPNAVVKLWPAAAAVTDPGAAPPPAEPLALVPVGLGILLLLRLHPRCAWLSRWPTAFAIGTTAGYSFVRYLRSDLLRQVEAGIRPGLVALDGGAVAWGDTLSNVLVLGGTICGLAYFTYTRAHRGGWGKMARIGIVFMMITFGTTFGYTVMARLALLISRFRFLLDGWLGLL